MGEMGELHWGMGYFGWPFMALFWGLVIVGIVACIKWLSTSSNHTNNENPLDILKKRYARGELNKEEFEHKKHELKV